MIFTVEGEFIAYNALSNNQPVDETNSLFCFAVTFNARLQPGSREHFQPHLMIHLGEVEKVKAQSFNEKMLDRVSYCDGYSSATDFHRAVAQPFQQRFTFIEPITTVFILELVRQRWHGAIGECFRLKPNFWLDDNFSWSELEHRFNEQWGGEIYGEQF